MAGNGSIEDTVTVLGCGMMGSALALALVDAGIRVVAWNRTAGKLEPLIERGVTGVPSASDAVTASSLVIACLTSYDDALEVLDRDTTPGDWPGRALINLATGTPQDAERLQRWAVDRGASYLDGTIQAYPQDIGKPESVVVYSGSADVWARHEPTLCTLAGASSYVSTDVVAANVVDVAVIGAFYTIALGAFVEAAAYADACGVGVDGLLDSADRAIELLRRSVHEGATAIASRRYETDQATLGIYAEASRSFLKAMTDAGQRASLMDAQLSNLERAEAAGHGALGLFALFDTTAATSGAAESR